MATDGVKVRRGMGELSFPLKRAGEHVRNHQRFTRILFALFCVGTLLLTISALALYIVIISEPLKDMNEHYSLVRETGRLDYTNAIAVNAVNAR